MSTADDILYRPVVKKVPEPQQSPQPLVHLEKPFSELKTVDFNAEMKKWRERRGDLESKGRQLLTAHAELSLQLWGHEYKRQSILAVAKHFHYHIEADDWLHTPVMTAETSDSLLLQSFVLIDLLARTIGDQGELSVGIDASVDDIYYKLPTHVRNEFDRLAKEREQS